DPEPAAHWYTFALVPNTGTAPFALVLDPAVAAPPAATPVAAGRVVIEAQVDGPATLYISKKGVYWVNGRNAKPGKHDNLDAPTYIDGQPWKPVWDDGGKPRGPGKTDVHPMALDPGKLQFQLLAVSMERSGSGILKRAPVVVKMV